MNQDLQSHSCLLLSATSEVPSQTPLPSAPTQFPFKLYLPAPQTMQSLDDGPEQLWQRGEHGWHVDPELKLPSGQGVPVEVVVWVAIHSLRSFAFTVNPDLHEMQVPLPSAHCVHPRWQTTREMSTY